MRGAAERGLLEVHKWLSIAADRGDKAASDLLKKYCKPETMTENGIIIGNIYTHTHIATGIMTLFKNSTGGMDIGDTINRNNVPC